MKALKSRTVWTITIMFIIGGVEAVAMFIPDAVETPLLAALGLAAAYFKLNPSQKY
jgi:hypothetical protein